MPPIATTADILLTPPPPAVGDRHATASNKYRMRRR